MPRGKKQRNPQIYHHWRLTQTYVCLPGDHKNHQADTWILGTALHRCTLPTHTQPSQSKTTTKIRYSPFPPTPPPVPTKKSLP